MQSFAQACSFSIATLQWHTPVPGLGPELCHDRGLAFPRPWDCVGVTVALGVSSVMVSGLACGSGTRAPLWPILPSTDTRVVSVVLRVKVLRSTHNYPWSSAGALCEIVCKVACQKALEPVRRLKRDERCSIFNLASDATPTHVGDSPSCPARGGMGRSCHPLSILPGQRPERR